MGWNLTGSKTVEVWSEIWRQRLSQHGADSVQESPDGALGTWKGDVEAEGAVPFNYWRWHLRKQYGSSANLGESNRIIS